MSGKHELIKVWPSVEATDRRSNVQRSPDLDGLPIVTRPHSVTPAGARSLQVAGQLGAELVEMRLDWVTIDAQSIIEHRGALWDVAEGPERVNGTRHVRHLKITLRRRQGETS